jgi:hypothetical protein
MPPCSGGLLRPRRERPRRRSVKRDDEFSTLDVNCHLTHDIIPSRAALRDFDPAYVGSGSTTAVTASQ